MLHSAEVESWFSDKRIMWRSALETQRLNHDTREACDLNIHGRFQHWTYERSKVPKFNNNFKVISAVNSYRRVLKTLWYI